MVKDIWEENPLLFHYTTAGGLQGILSSQSIRATHDMHMNDSLEMALLHKRLADHFAPYFKVPLVEAAKNNNQVSEKVKALGEINAMAVVEAKRLCEGLQKGTFKLEGHPDYFEPFIISFCGHQKEYERQHGLLSQWRAYGRAGYVIAFETRKMVEFVKADTDVYAYNGCQVGDVVYDGDDGRFNSEFAELLSAIPQVVSKWFYHEPPNFAPIYDPWLRSVSRF